MKGYPATTEISYPLPNNFLPFFLPPKREIPWYSVNVSDFPISAEIFVSLALETLWTSMLYQKHGEGVTRKRTQENQDELIRTNLTPDGGNLPTICLNVIKYP